MGKTGLRPPYQRDCARRFSVCTIDSLEAGLATAFAATVRIGQRDVHKNKARGVNAVELVRARLSREATFIECFGRAVRASACRLPSAPHRAGHLSAWRHSILRID